MKALKDLEKRLEEATGRDLELDADLWSIWDKRPLEGVCSDAVIYKRDPHDRIAFDAPPPYTASLDAAVSLCERVLPGWWMMIVSEGKHGWSAQLGNGGHGIEGGWGRKPSAALAVCLVTVRILLSKGGDGD